LGRSEFKQLLRWRLGLRKALKTLLGSSPEDEAKKGSHKKQQQQQPGADADAAAEGGEGQQEEDAEQRLLAEMESIKDAAEKR
jgi:AdoMet-dependent rRNA methyltransferase SPB1